MTALPSRRQIRLSKRTPSAAAIRTVSVKGEADQFIMHLGTANPRCARHLSNDSSCLRIAVGSRLLHPPHLLGQRRSDLQIAAAIVHLRRVLAVSFAEETDQSAES